MGVTKREAYFNSTDGINKVHVYYWLDTEATPVAILQLSHGLGEHTGRYEDFALYLAEKGFIVCGNDHLGHGKTAPTIGELGDFGAPDAYIRMVDDMHVLHNIMVKHYPKLPYFILGHSMGSFCARLYAFDFGDELAGAIFSGSACMPDALSLLEEPLEAAVEKSGRNKRASSSDTMYRMIGKYLFDEDDAYAWLCASKDDREKIIADPLCGSDMTMGSLLTLFKLATKCNSEDWYKNFPKDLPVLVVSGVKDIVGEYGHGVTKLTDKLEQNGVDVTMRLFPGLRHNILNEDDKDIVYNDIYSWLSQHI